MELIINGYEERQKLVAILAENGYAVLVKKRENKESNYPKYDMVIQIRASL